MAELLSPSNLNFTVHIPRQSSVKNPDNDIRSPLSALSTLQEYHAYFQNKYDSLSHSTTQKLAAQVAELTPRERRVCSPSPQSCIRRKKQPEPTAPRVYVWNLPSTSKRHADRLRATRSGRGKLVHVTHRTHAPPSRTLAVLESAHSVRAMRTPHGHEGTSRGETRT